MEVAHLLTAKSWTAVVRGAVIVGIEKDNERADALIKIKSCQQNYGLMLAKTFSLIHDNKKDMEPDKVTRVPLAMNQMVWLFKKGDAILSNRAKVKDQTFSVRFTSKDEKTGEIPIFTYPDEELPTTLEDGECISCISKAVLTK